MRYYSSTFAKTTLVGDITASVTSISLASVTGLPASFPYTLILSPDGVDEEVVEATAISGNIVTVTRGVDGTSAQTHTAGAPVAHGVSARDFAEPQNHIAASQAVHGVAAGSSVVGTADTQTLTNKTLTSPTINTPSISSGTLTNSTLDTPTLSSPASTGGTFTSALAKTFTAQANAVGDVSAIIQAIAGQTGDVLTVKDTAGVARFRVLPDGTTRVGETSAGYGRFTTIPVADNDIGQVIRQFSATQSGALLDFRAADGTTVLASFKPDGSLSTPAVSIGGVGKTLKGMSWGSSGVATDANGRVVFPHNLGVTPSVVLLTPLQANAIFISITNDATNCTIEARKTDGTNALIASTSVSFVWMATI